MDKPNGLTYAGSGVDIDAGNAMVDAIRPLVRATRRPGSDAEIGGFGGLFDLKAAGFRDPILVAANDGVGTKVKICYLYLADRRTDLILAGGANIYPAEVEAALDEHPTVQSCCVIGLPDED